MELALRRSSYLKPVNNLGAAWKSLAAIAVTILGVGAVVLTREEPPTAVDGEASTSWLSGEARGRIVLVAPRSERPSIAVELDGEPTSYNLAELGDVVLVHDRRAGEVLRLDSRNGEELGRRTAPIEPDDALATLMRAGKSAYLVNRSASVVQRLEADGNDGPAVTIEGGFSDWVTTPDGLLWLFDDRTGSYTRFDGELTSDDHLVQPAGAPFIVSAIGTDPVVYDASTSRLNWIRRFVSVDVPIGPTDNPARIVLQQPDPAARCAAVLSGTLLSCLSPNEVVRSLQLPQPMSLGDATLVADEDQVVVTWTGAGDVRVVRWNGEQALGERSEPSGRATVGTHVSGALVIDDPASRYSVSVDQGRITQLDKFSKRTIVLSDDDSGNDGSGQLDELADVAGVFTENGQTGPAPEDDGTNELPVAVNDGAVTRTGRSVTIPVLANDFDPDGDPISVTEVGPLASVDGLATVLQGSRINYEPPAQSNNRSVDFPYRIADVTGAESSATVTVTLIGDGSNSPPEVADDSATTTAGTAVDIDVVGNDSDREGDPLTITALTEPLRGTGAISSDGVIRYQPDPGFTGIDRFGYTVDDGYGGTSSAQVEVSVIAKESTNQAPIARDDRTAANTGVLVRIDPLANDVDPDGDRLRIVNVSTPAGVDVAIVDEQALDILADETVAGLQSITYTIADPDGLQASARITLVVEQSSSEQPPVAIDDKASTAGAPVDIAVTANDVDPSGAQLVIIESTQPPASAGRSVATSPTTIRFTPAPNFIGVAAFSYTVQNPSGLVDSATVRVTVTPPTGSGPVANNDSKVLFVGESAQIAPLSNDSHPDGLAFDFAGPPVTRGGTAVVNPDQTITFTPSAIGPAVYVLTYTIQDVNGLRATADITLTYVERSTINNPPLARDDVGASGSTAAVIIDALANDEDPDGDVLRITAVGAPTAGTASIVGDRIRFAPPSAFAGVAVMQYTIADDEGLTATARITIQVAARVAVPPSTTPDLVTVAIGATTTIDPAANDVDPDGSNDDLTVSGVGASSPAGVSATTNGRTVRLVSGGTAGVFELSYTITDRDGLGATGTIKVIVQALPNQPPVAVNDSATGLALPMLIPVLDNDSDPDGGELTVKSIGAVAPGGAGTATLATNGISFSPPSTFNGSATFSYTVSDPQGATDTATVTVDVVACAPVPTLSPLAAYTAIGAPVSISLFGGAGPPSGVTMSIGTPSTGSATLNDAGSMVRYQPPSGFAGNASISYTAKTSCGAATSSTINVTVNRPPVAVDDVASTDANTSVTVSVLANDDDPDGDALQLTTVFDVLNGQVSTSGDVVTFTPAAGFRGTGSFTYRIRDAGSYTAVATVMIIVANAPPVANDDRLTIFTRSSPATIDVLLNDTDLNGDPLTLTAAGPTTAGSVARVGNSVRFTPATSQGPGTISIPYIISDGAATGTGAIIVTIRNQAPIAVPDQAQLDLAAASTISVNVLANDSDPDGEVTGLNISAVGTAPGTVTRSGGTITYRPQTSVVTPSTVIISYTIVDPFGDSAQGSLTISVVDSTPPPTTTTTTEPPTTTTEPPTTTTQPPTTTTTEPPTTTTQPPTTTTTEPPTTTTTEPPTTTTEPPTTTTEPPTTTTEPPPPEPPTP